MRTVIGAILVLATTATLAGCGTVRVPPAEAATSSPDSDAGAPAPGLAAPPAGRRAEAAALAGRLLSGLRLPAGTRRLPQTPAPRYLSQPASEPGDSALLDAHRFFAVPASPAALSGYLVAHVPAGLTAGGTGQSSGPGQPTELDVSYVARKAPAGIYSAQVTLTIVPDSSGGSLLRADAQVIWYPSRTAAEYVDPARYHVLTLAVTIYGRSVHTIYKVVTSQADIARLAEALDRSPAEPPIAINCPAIWLTYKLSLSVSRHARPAVVISTNSIGCGGTAITVNGRPQPALADGGAVAAAANQALGYTPKPSL
jgi:predicted small lipoprotein YifL